MFENTRHGPAMIHCQSQQIVLLLFFPQIVQKNRCPLLRKNHLKASCWATWRFAAVFEEILKCEGLFVFFLSAFIVVFSSLATQQ